MCIGVMLYTEQHWNWDHSSNLPAMQPSHLTTSTWKRKAYNNKSSTRNISNATIINVYTCHVHTVTTFINWYWDDLVTYFLHIHQIWWHHHEIEKYHKVIKAVQRTHQSDNMLYVGIMVNCSFLLYNVSYLFSRIFYCLKDLRID